MASKQRSKDLALGLTTIVVLVLFAGTIVFLYPLFQTDGLKIKVVFPHQQGMAPLKSGSPVKLAGALEIGSVERVYTDRMRVPAFGDEETTFFVVEAEVDHDIPLHGNCRITTDQPAIGGSGFVSILYLGTPGAALEQPIAGMPPQSLASTIGELSRRLLEKGGIVDHIDTALDPQAEGSVMAKLVKSLDDINRTTEKVREQLEPGDVESVLGKVHQMLDDLNAMTAALSAQMQAGDEAALLAKVHVAVEGLSAALSEATAMLQEDRPVVLDTLVSMRSAARAVDEDILGRLRQELDRSEPTSVISKVHTAMDHVNSSLRELESITSEAERTVVLSRPSLESALLNFELMSEQLALASQELKLNPSRLIWGPDEKRREKLIVFEAARSFAQAATELDRATHRLQAVLKALPEDGKPTTADLAELRAIQQAVEGAFERFNEAEEALWNQLK